MLTDGVSYQPDPKRYDGRMIYRRVGHWGLQLPAISLGFWKNFGDAQPFETQRAVVRAAFDAGVTHFDLANNYGPPYGQAEINFGTLLRTDLAPYRDELVVSTKAGYDMWPGPYGQGGGSRKYIRASLDQSLARLGLDYVDMFYSHRFDPETPLEETMMALDRAVRSGKALYAAISNYPAAETEKAAQIARELGTPLLIHQARYSIFNRWVEGGGDGPNRESLLDRAEAEGMGVMAFSPLQQGLLTSRYLKGVPDDSRARHSSDFRQSWLDEDTLAQVRALNDIAAGRGQSLAQMALAWLLRDERVSSVVIGASSVKQLANSLGALKNLDFTAEELAAIDAHAARPGHELWGN